MRFLCALALPLAVASHDYPVRGKNELDAGGGGKCTYSYSNEHDGEPVVMSAVCSITSADKDMGTSTDQADRDYTRALGEHDGCVDDDAGHILANRLGGLAEPTNLFPQQLHLNRGPWKTFEGDVYDCVSETTSVDLAWTFHYASTEDQRPTSVKYAATYSSSACNDTSVTFENPCDQAAARRSGDAAVPRRDVLSPCGCFWGRSRRRRGCDVDISRRRASATPRLPRGYFAETPRPPRG